MAEFVCADCELIEDGKIHRDCTGAIICGLCYEDHPLRCPECHPDGPPDDDTLSFHTIAERTRMFRF